MDKSNSYISRTFTRMDLERISKFFLYGEEHKTQHSDLYFERLEKASKPIYNRINSLYPNASDLTEPTNELSHALSTFQEVYMEIGMKAGARLLYQLMLEDEKPAEKSAK
ncbi:MAG: hypothetical protein FWE20_10595 [Defluviitaleaceae bacterium]|nr:hypothetical protein [Defluviitaleaceae bacterium]